MDSRSPSRVTTGRAGRRRGAACTGDVGLDSRLLPGGAGGDVRDVRRAAAAAEDRHRERQQDRGVLPLCPEIRRRAEERRPVGRGARNGGLGGKPPPAGPERVGRGGRHRSERRGERRESSSTFKPWAACTTSPCGSSTAAKSGSSASASSRASASASGPRAAAPTPSPCGCLRSTG